MPDYQQGKIYRLVSNKTEDVYYGATTRALTHRKNQHKKSSNDCSSKKLFENDAIVTIVLVEAFPCNNKNELKARELFHITNNACINTNKPFISELNHGVEWHKKYREANKEHIKAYHEAYNEAHKEHKKAYNEAYNEAHKEQQKEYREANREALSEQKKEWYESNKETILEHQKAYREANKEAISEYKKAYNEANKEAIAEYHKVYREANREAISERKKQAYKNKKSNV